MFDPCERCGSRFPPEVCKKFCHLYKMVVAERGSQTAYSQLQDKIIKEARKR